MVQFRGRSVEAFSDGVIAIIITIMVLEIKAPESDELSALLELAPKFLSYVLSFTFVAVYWNNHHHILQVVKNIDGRSLWANMHLLFWLSLVPFAADWMGEHQFTRWPVMLYGLILVLCAVAFSILVRVLLKVPGKNTTLLIAVGNGKKIIASISLNIVGIALALLHPWIGFGFFVISTSLWLVPSKRIENLMAIEDSKRD